MQDMIVLQTEVEKMPMTTAAPAEPIPEPKPHRPIVICRPEYTPDKPRKPEPVPEPEPDFPEQTEPMEPQEILREEAPQQSTPPQVTFPLHTRKSRAGLVRIAAAALIFSAVVWAYPRLCPTLDKFCYQMLKISAMPTQTASEPEQQTESEPIEPDEPQPEESEPTASEPEQEEPEPEQTSAAEETPVIGTIHNTDGDGTVNVQTFSATAGGIYIPLEHGLIKNAASVSNAVLKTAAKGGPAFTLTDTDAPQILIMHTHTTESYLSDESDSYNTKFNFRTRDNSQNMVRVGEAIADALKEAGIGVLHDTTQHDYPSYTGSYARSAETVKQYLKEYPSIKIVLDIHRDAIGSDNTITAPTTTIDGRKAAQLMIISGCDDGTMDMPDYLKNFGFAAALQNQIELMYPTLTRPVLFDYRKYNQDLTTGSLLVEIGSNANTLDQAVYTGKLLGNALAKLCELQIKAES